MKDLRVSFPGPCTERWDDMAPRGCNRHCASCDKIIHDLAQMTAGEAEALLASGGEVCVRAQIGADGLVKLRPGGNGRRLVAAIGASVGLLTATSPALAADGKPRGAIKGEVLGACGGGSVTATAADGRIYQARIGTNNRYKVKRLPDGAYDVKFNTNGEESWSGGRVAIQNGRTVELKTNDPRPCIIVGMIQVEDRNG